MYNIFNFLKAFNSFIFFLWFFLLNLCRFNRLLFYRFLFLFLRLLFRRFLFYWFLLFRSIFFYLLRSFSRNRLILNSCCRLFYNICFDLSRLGCFLYSRFRKFTRNFSRFLSVFHLRSNTLSCHNSLIRL